MAGIPNDIKIQYFNQTGVVDLEVVVFTENAPTTTPENLDVVWHVLKTQTSSTFTYPVKLEVGAYWTSGAVSNTAGPFPADLGDTWQITMEGTNESPSLTKVTGVAPNPDGTVVIKNKKPATWSGQPFSMGLYKDGSLLVTQKNVGIGSQAYFELTPKLYFGVVSDIHVGDIVKSDTISQTLCVVNLSKFTNGLKMTLTKNPASGEYTFTPSKL